MGVSSPTADPLVRVTLEGLKRMWRSGKWSGEASQHRAFEIHPAERTAKEQVG